MTAELSLYEIYAARTIKIVVGVLQGEDSAAKEREMPLRKKRQKSYFVECGARVVYPMIMPGLSVKGNVIRR